MRNDSETIDLGGVTYGPANPDGVRVARDVPETWLVGTWQYDTVQGPIGALCARMVNRIVYGDDDYAPLRVYVLEANGELVEGTLTTGGTTQPGIGLRVRQVHVTRNRYEGVTTVASALIEW